MLSLLGLIGLIAWFGSLAITRLVGTPVAATPTPIYNRSFHAQTTDADFIKRVQPEYPMEARSRGIEGTAVVTVTINPAGGLVAAKIHKTSGSVFLDDAALRAARLSTFQGPSKTSSYLIEYVFKLD